jgi:hypothetical protein
VNRFTRRRFVKHGATVAGAASATALLGGTGLGRALAASATGALSEARRKTYGAVVEAVALAKHSGVSASNLDGTTRRFESIYDRADEGFRTGVDSVLDRLEEAAGADGFTALDARARLKLLREWTKGGKHEVRGIGCGTLVGAASQYAGMPFHPDPFEDPRTLAVHI